MKTSKVLLASVALAVTGVGVNSVSAACPAEGATIYLQGTLVRNRILPKGLGGISDIAAVDGAIPDKKFNKATGLVALGFGWSLRYGDACLMPWLEFGVGFGKAKRQYNTVDANDSAEVTKISLRRTFGVKLGADICWLVTPQFGIGLTAAVGLNKYTGRVDQTSANDAVDNYSAKMKKNKMRFGVVAGPVLKFYPIPDVSIFAKGLFGLNKQKCGELPASGDGSSPAPVKNTVWEFVLGVSKTF